MTAKCRYMALLLVCGLLVWLTPSAMGTTYYVSPTGSSENPGTRAEPWSLAKANTTLQAGDTAILLNGSYSTRIEPSNSGSSGDPITYEAENSRQAVLTTEVYRIYISNRSYITIDGIKAENCSRWVYANYTDHITINDCYFNGSTGWESMRFQGTNGYITVTNCDIIDGTDSLHIREGTHHYIANNFFQTASHTCLVLMGVENSVVENNTLTNIGQKCMEVFSTRGVYDPPDKSQYNTIQRNWFGPTTSSGIQYAGSNSILRWNVFDDCVRGMAWSNYGGSDPNDDPEAWWDEHNRFYHNVLYDCETACSSAMLNSLSGLNDNIHRNNIIYNGTSAKQVTFDWDGVPTNLTFYYNNIIHTAAGQDVFWWFDKPGDDDYFTLAEIETAYPANYADNIEVNPQFVDAGTGDFHLASNSDCIDAGAPLTLTNGSGTGRTITVDDALYFMDGYGLVDPDVIRIGNDTCTVSDVDYANDQIVVEDTITWSDGEDVSMDYLGDGPDMGMFEYDSGTASNTAPTADAGSDDECTLPNYATLDGTVSDDGLPDPPASLTTTWSKDSGPGTVTFGDASAVDTTAGFSVEGTYILKLEADDGTLSDSDTVQIVVNPQPAQNSAPTADAGSDDEITLPNHATLNGTVSDDGLPSPPGTVTTTWSKDSGPGTVTFGDASAVDTTAGFSVEGTYVLKLEADDSDLADSDTVQIVVNEEGTGPLMSDDFNDNDISDWTTVAGTGWDAAGGQATKLADDTVDAAIEKGGFSVSSGVITLQFDLTVANDWRLGNAGLVDASGDGVFLGAYVGDTYVEIGARNTADNALTGTGGSMVDATCDASAGITIKYEVNLDTGEVKGYIDDDLENTVYLDLSGVGAITDVVFQARKEWYLDNVVVDGPGGGPSNTAPTADAGSNDSITLPNYATLDGTVSDDGLPDPPASLSTTWTKTSGPGTVTFGNSAAVDTTAGFSENGVYVLQLMADDGTLNDSDTVQITVNHLAPTADAGSDDSVTLPNYATLDGTISDDGFPLSPGAVTTTWTKTSGPGTVTFGNSAAVDTTAGFSEAGAYVLQLEASDGDLSDSDTVAITVNAAGLAPFAEEGGTVVMEAENFDTNDTRSDGEGWWLDSTGYAGYVGDGHMEAPAAGTETWADAAELTYEIDFSTAGTYYIWVRRWADKKQENTAFVGLDDTQIGGIFDDEEANYDQWYWKEHGTAVYISATQHTFNLRRREKEYGVDRIILTDDSGYTPSGNGPAESLRE